MKTRSGSPHFLGRLPTAPASVSAGREADPKASALASESFRRNIAQTAVGGALIAVGRSFTLVSRFIIGLLLARMLGAEQYGLYNLALTAATLASGVAVLGLDSGLVRYVAMFVARRDERSLLGALQLGVGLPAILSLFLAAALAALADPIARDLFHEPQLASLLHLASIAVPLLVLTDVLAAATRGFKQMRHMVISQHIAQPIVRTAAVLALALTIGLTPARAVAAFILAGVATVVLLFYFLNGQFSLRRPISLSRGTTREVMSFSVPVYLSDLLGTFSGSIQIVALGTLASIANVGIFAVAANVNMVGKLMRSAVTLSAMPVIAELYDRSDRLGLARFYQLIARWTITLTLPSFLVVLLFPRTLLSIFGESFVAGSEVLVILTVANLLYVSTSVCGTMLDMTGHTRLKLANSVASIALTIGLSLALIPGFGIVGAALAGLIDTAIIGVLELVEVLVVVRLFPYDASFLKPVLAGLLSVGAVIAVAPLMAGWPDPAQLVAQGAALVAAYGCLIFALGLEPEDRMLLGRLIGRAKAVLAR